MQAVAKAKFIRMSPIKLDRVISLVRGKIVEEALDQLHYMRKDAAITVRKAILSAVFCCSGKHHSHIKTVVHISAPPRRSEGINSADNTAF